MKAPLKTQNICLLLRNAGADLPTELDGGLVCLGAGVADEGLCGGAHGAGGEGGVDEEFAEGAGPGVVVEVAAVDEGEGLVVEDGGYVFVAVAEGVDGDAGCLLGGGGD